MNLRSVLFVDFAQHRMVVNLLMFRDNFSVSSSQEELIVHYYYYYYYYCYY